METLHKLRIHYNGERTRLVVREELERFEQIMEYRIRRNLLLREVMDSSTPGVSDKRYFPEEVIVSLTTFDRRLFDVCFTIESIMQGTVKPNRIILWLQENMADNVLPVTLQKQQKRGLEIRFYKDIRSYLKLIPALQIFPDASVITIDDDAIYDFDLVEKLVNTHKAHPHHIVANRIHRVVLGPNKRPVNYPLWKGCSNPADDSPLNFATGVGGILFPPHTLHSEVFNEKVYMKLCPYADDIWFYAMTLMKGTKVMKCPTRSRKGNEFVLNEEVQDLGLCQINTIHGKGTYTKNDIQLKAVFDKYNLWDRLTATKCS